MVFGIFIEKGTHVVHVSDPESEATREVDTNSQLASLPVVPGSDSRASLSEELAEGDGDSGLVSCTHSQRVSRV